MKSGRPAGVEHLDQSPVPEAMGRLLARLAAEVGPGTMDRVWVFPPLVRGRREWGLVAVSCFEGDPTLRTLVTARYVAEMTGKGITFDAEVVQEGAVPPDRLPRIMDGVVRRSELNLGIPREVEVRGNPDRFLSLQEAYNPSRSSGAEQEH